MQAIEWFTTIPNKEKKSFFKFDIINFYPSISEELLTKALDWVQTLTSISQDDRSTIMHCRQGFLFFEQESWVKKENSEFDVSQGSLDSAEVCELVGLFILNEIEKQIPKEHTGLYRDDGLAVTSLPGVELNRLQKEIISTFKSHGLQITV